MNANKRKLRYELIQLRKQKPERFILNKSEKISKNLVTLHTFNTASHILFYVSYDGEVHTHTLIKKAFLLNKNVYVPISEPKTYTLIISKLDEFSDLIPGTYNILEPKKEKIHPIPLHRIETIIVPGVGFTLKGHRLGQGGGYYDWLLSNTKAVSIALSFEFQIKDFIPTESHDQRVDYIVTEKRIIDCS